MTMKARRLIYQARMVLAIATLAVTLCGAAQASEVSVAMSSSGDVAGLQMDLFFDPSCMKAQSAGNGVACNANNATGKDVMSSTPTAQSVRILMFSMHDSSPIPDGDLFTCSFTTTGGGKDPCCGLHMGNVVLSDPNGQAEVSSATFQAAVDGVPCSTGSKTGGSTGNQPVMPAAPAAPGYNAAPPAAEGGAAAPVHSAPGSAPGSAPSGVGQTGGGAQAPYGEGEPGEAEAQPTATYAAPRAVATTPRKSAATATAAVRTPTPHAKIATPAKTPSAKVATPTP